MQNKIKKLKEIKILFVEDEINLIKIISDTLSKLGANFVTANNGAEGLEQLEKNPDVQLIVTDINMPIMNGLDMIREVRKTNATLPCIVMSAHTEAEYLQSADELQVAEYILKPFDFINFINVVDNLNIK